MASSNETPDKNNLYGEFQRGERWRDRLARKLAHKSLDIGDAEDMHVDNSRHQHGLAWKELAILALGVGLFWSVVADRLQPEPVPAPPAQPAATAEPLRGKIRFWVDDPNVSIQQSPDQ